MAKQESLKYKTGNVSAGKGRKFKSQNTAKTIPVRGRKSGIGNSGKPMPRKKNTPETENISLPEIKKPLSLKIGSLEINHQGQGKFLYFYRKGGALNAGVIKVTRKHMSVAAIVTVLVTGILLSFSFFRTEKAVKQAKAKDKIGIGGVGRLESGKVIDKVTDLKANITQYEEDEKIKDQLMGVVQEQQIEEKEELDKKGRKKVKKIAYKVKPGDTLSKIAKKYKVTTSSIADTSKLGNKSLKVGQTLVIPARVGFYYTVKKNERLANILTAHKVTLEKFIGENPYVNTDLLDSGEEIFLPGAKPIKKPEGWLIPVPSRVITSGYGYRKWPRAAFHKGLDLKAFYVPVRASKAGTVTYSGWLGGYGNAVIVTHDNGYKTLYAHLSKRHVSAGMKITRGQKLGRSGDTGYSFGPHLHVEISKDGKNLNPAKLLKGLRRRR